MNRLGVALLATVSVLFIGILTVWSIGFLTLRSPIAIVGGIVLLFFALLGGWAMWNELSFGVRAQRLGRELEAAGGMPEEEVSLHASGRVVQSEGEAVLPRYLAESEAAPDDWRAAYRLGLAYDAAGDRNEARAQIRRAIRLSRVR